jgi:hypothetical protein
MRASACRDFFICAACAATSIASCGISHNPRRPLDRTPYNFGLGAFFDPYVFVYGGRWNRFPKNHNAEGSGAAG